MSLERLIAWLFVIWLASVLLGCAPLPPPAESPCKPYQPPRGWCAYTDAQ